MKTKWKITEIYKFLFAIYFFVVLFILYTGIKTFAVSGYYNLLIIGLILTIPLIFYYLKKMKNKELRNIKLNEKQEKFKKTARTITVNLENAEIISNEWNEEIVEELNKHTSLSKYMNYPENNLTNVNRIINNVKIRIPIKGKEKIVQFNIEMDTKNLKIKMALKKETTYYYDINNSEMDFLDLSFLYENQ